LHFIFYKSCLKAGFTKNKIDLRIIDGSAATIVMSPIVPNFEKFPHTGRDEFETYGEIGLAGHWLKRILHTIFIYKAKANPFWWIIPE